MSLDDNQSKLVLIQTEVEPKPRNYWNTSGLKKEFFPSEPRPESIPTLNKHGRVIQEPQDEWWINSKEHNYCFWSYIRDKSQPDGTMEPLLQSEMSKLFGCSSTKVHFMLKEAMDKLLTAENIEVLQILHELSEEEPFEDVSLYSSISELEIPVEEEPEE